MRGRGEVILGWFRFGFSGSNMLETRGGVLGRRRTATIPSIVSGFPASKTMSFLHTLSSFNQGELR